jgi:hypothetical protein
MKALKVKLGRLTLEQLAKEYPDAYPVKLKDHNGRIRLIVELPRPENRSWHKFQTVEIEEFAKKA